MMKSSNNLWTKPFLMVGLLSLILLSLTGCGSLSQTAGNVAETTNTIKRQVAVVAGRVDKVTGEVERTTEQVEAVRNDVKESIDNVRERVDETVTNVSDRVNDRIDRIDSAIDEKIETLRANVSEEVTKAIAPLDSNGDGKADIGEAIAHLKKDNNWQDWEQWLQVIIAVVGSWLGLQGVKKGGKPLVAALHKTGRSELARRGEPSQNGSDGGGSDPPAADSS